MSESRGPFEPLFDELPAQIPLFPLPGALVLPGGRLPLNIFEPRYLAMVRDAIASPHRLIGMIQPKDELSDETDDNHSLYQIGCAGRISSFNESDDGRILITLSGVARFQCEHVVECEDGYFMARCDWRQFASDLRVDNSTVNRETLTTILRHYFDVKGFQADWEHIEACEDERLISTLSMICPFSVPEKQALLEAKNLDSRAQLLIAIMEMATHAYQDDIAPKH